MKCACGSYAINQSQHGRDGSDPDLCDACYWRKRAERVKVLEAALGEIAWSNDSTWQADRARAALEKPQ